MNDDLKARLTELGLDDEQIGKLTDQGVLSEDEMVLLNEQEIRDITGCNLITGKKVAAAFAPKPTEAESAASSAVVVQNLLPALPDDESFIEKLKVGGVLKIDATNVIAAMRAAIASRVGLYSLPDTLMARMEAFADEQEEPVGEDFYTLQKLLTRREYGDILSVLGTNGSFMTKARKAETLRRLEEILWPALRDYNTQLRTWGELWSQGMSNPAAMMAIFMSGGSHGIMPPGMLQPPDTAVLRDEGEAVINRINKVFAGTGIPVARALAYDAMQIKQVLDNPSLPTAVGAANRDQMLKMLGIDVGADFVRLEQNVTRFALAIMNLPKVAAGNEELSYFGAMYTLGVSIPWDKLTSVGGTVSSSRRPGRQPALVAGDSGWDGSTGGGLYKSER